MFEAKPQGLNRKNLIYVSNLLKGIEHFVFFGTLLGLVRDGDIIPHDDDVDFYVPIEQRAAVIERLKTTDFSIYLNTDGDPNQPLCIVRAYKFINGMQLDIDFYFYQSKPETDCIIERWNVSGRPNDIDTHLHIPKSMIFPLKTQRFFDCDIAMPAKGEDLCEFLYGKDWRTPLRKYTEYIPEITDNNLACAEVAPMPNKIYAFWMQGRENAPELVRMNLDRWEQLNPDYELIVLDKETAQPYLADFPIDPNKPTVQTFSDILRVRLLAQTGGIWTDASVYPVKPLSNWLDTHMQRQTFFAYTNPSRYLMPIGSWFLVAREDCPMIKKWNDLITRYWFMERTAIHQENDTGEGERGGFYCPADVDVEMGLLDMHPTPGYPYFWVHHLFGHLLRHDADFADQWDAITDNNYLPAITLDNLHQNIFFYPINDIKSRLSWRAHKGLFKMFNSSYTRFLLSRANMHKLNWRRKSYPLKTLENFRK